MLAPHNRVAGQSVKDSRPFAGPRAVPTVGAAKYLGVSPSLMRKWRQRGPDDPGLSGPDFIRVGPTLVLYEIEALDAWIERRKSVSQRPRSDLGRI